MNRDYEKELRNFKAVWDRVSENKELSSAEKSKRDISGINLMPRKKRKGNASRFGPSS